MREKKLFDLKDQVAVVTGGAGVLGQEMVKALCGAGAQVVILGRNLDDDSNDENDTPEHDRELAADGVDHAVIGEAVVAACEHRMQQHRRAADERRARRQVQPYVSGVRVERATLRHP